MVLHRSIRSTTGDLLNHLLSLSTTLILVNTKRTSVVKKSTKSHAENTFGGIADWNRKARRKTIKKLLDSSLVDRLPELTSLRFERMTASPFGFFRGSACVMAYDLSLGKSSSVYAQLCGDAHVQNLGAFEGEAGELTFDINDFDETAIGPFEWDLKRMATSIFLAGRDAGLKEAAIAESAKRLPQVLHPADAVLSAHAGA